jgi:hypothetical protein
MRREEVSEITIHLDNIQELFVAPVIDPFSKQTSFVSGIELIKNELKARSWTWIIKARIRIRIFLPKERLEPNLASKIAVALKRYCQFKVQQNKQTMIMQRRSALRALLIGILFLLCGLYLSQFLARLTIDPPFIKTLFGDGFDIAFWVILWRPVDFFLFDLWPFWSEERFYKRLMETEIIVVEEQSRQGTLRG